jgi:hypothetical protein
MSIEPQTIDCEQHGQSIGAIVCRHLVNNHGHPLGFVENSADPNDLQGWCYACEYFFQQQEDMTEEFMKFCDGAVVCIDCYAAIKSKHSISALFGANA